ncbi:DUF6491 family protein [Paraglaciecola sp.]|uniref:DUF6491 family protein n=1 Tax=Paraglaciecola sp. TaxID=1920173 RepID=UPI00273EEEA0|nr:DUF6491 family protein [Paraglaciecola sp.]MDP5029116.1 DUF6491 family protein [Paraglaciecola sp.]
MKKYIFVLMSLLVLGGCATRQLSEAEKSTLIEGYITTENLEQRSSISAFNLDSWSALSDQYVILRSSPFRSYLVKLANRCHDLAFSPTLVVNSRMSGSLSTGFDSVYTPENVSFKCFISRIYPLTKEQNKSLLSAISDKEEEALQAGAASQDQVKANVQPR